MFSYFNFRVTYIFKRVYVATTLFIVALTAQIACANDDINSALDNFHLAAAKANFDGYFDLLTEDAVFLGTDGSERWTKSNFKKYVKPHFDKGNGWEYRVVSRNITTVKEESIYFFDEILMNDFYGKCRGTGVIVRQNNQWKIMQYSLAVMVPNELSKKVISIIKNVEPLKQK